MICFPISKCAGRCKNLTTKTSSAKDENASSEKNSDWLFRKPFYILPFFILFLIVLAFIGNRSFCNPKAIHGLTSLGAWGNRFYDDTLIVNSWKPLSAVDSPRPFYAPSPVNLPVESKNFVNKQFGFYMLAVLWGFWFLAKIRKMLPKQVVAEDDKIRNEKVKDNEGYRRILTWLVNMWLLAAFVMGSMLWYGISQFLDAAINGSCADVPTKWVFRFKILITLIYFLVPVLPLLMIAIVKHVEKPLRFNFLSDKIAEFLRCLLIQWVKLLNITLFSLTIWLLPQGQDLFI